MDKQSKPNSTALNLDQSSPVCQAAGCGHGNRGVLGRTPAPGGCAGAAPSPLAVTSPAGLLQPEKHLAMAADKPFQPGPESIHHLIYLTALSLSSPASTRLCLRGGNDWARGQLWQNLKSNQ